MENREGKVKNESLAVKRHSSVGVFVECHSGNERLERRNRQSRPIVVY